MTREERHRLDEEHVRNPQEGDFWHEMFSPYFLVVAVGDKGVLVVHKTVPVGRDHYRFDENELRYMTRQELRDKVTYPSMRDKFVADVIPRRRLV